MKSLLHNQKNSSTYIKLVELTLFFHNRSYEAVYRWRHKSIQVIIKSKLEVMFIPAALVTKKFVFSIQCLCWTEVFQTTCNWTVLFNIKAQVKKYFIPSCHSFTTQAPSFVGEYSLTRSIHKNKISKGGREGGSAIDLMQYIVKVYRIPSFARNNTVRQLSGAAWKLLEVNCERVIYHVV